jgi:PAS domain S-box-containing protein
MLNEQLKQQLRKYLGEIELTEEWQAFLQEVSDTYDNLETGFGSKQESLDENAEAVKELNIKLRNEAEELKKSHAELGRILNSVNHGFFSRNILTDSYDYLSLACERIYGYNFDEFLKNSALWYEVIPPEDRAIVERDNEQLNGGKEVSTQYRIIHKDKSIRWVELTLIPFLRDGKLVRVDGVVNDITKRKEAETEREVMMNELIKTNADLKQFSFITSHNLRSPLSNIKAIVNLFDFNEKDTHNKQMLEMMKGAVQKLNTTIEDLIQILVVKNNVNPQLTSLGLEEVFNQVLPTFTNALSEVGGKVITNFQSSFVLLNKVFLESIFINLISNAIKYRSPERNLLIRVESTEDEAGCVKMKFSDNGVGIDLSKHQGKVFGLYQRFHDEIEGKGLGLFIVKSQIESAGGNIALESKPGVGTTFILTLKR